MQHARRGPGTPKSGKVGDRDSHPHVLTMPFDPKGGGRVGGEAPTGEPGTPERTGGNDGELAEHDLQ